MGKLITITEASERLGLTAQTLRNWTKGGYLTIHSVGKAKYIDEDTILALQDSVEDVKLQKKRLDSLAAEIRADRQVMLYEYLDKKDKRRYLSFVASVSLKNAFFETVIDLLWAYGSLSDRERFFLSGYFRGVGLEEIAEKYGLTRERVRQIVERAIRKSSDVMRIKEKLDRADEIITENAALKAVNVSLQQRIAQYEKEVDSIDDELVHEKCRLFATKVVDLPISVRAINCLKAGRTERHFSFTEKTTFTVVVPACETLGDVCKLKKSDVLKLRNMGKKTLREITDYLSSVGLTFEMDVDAYYRKKVNDLKE